MTIPKPLAYLLFSVPWLAAVFGFGFLIYLRFPPSGVFATATQLDGKSPWIFPFLPSDRASTPGLQPDGWMGQRVTDDPTYFSARVPGPYESADVSLEFRTLNQPLLELGIVRDAQGNNLEMKPMYSSELDSAEWKEALQTGVHGYVRTSESDARLTSSDPHGTAVWDASSSMPLLRDPAMEATTTETSLRGAHDFYLVPAGGAINATFDFQDANRGKADDVIAFRVTYGDEEIPEATFALNLSSDKRMGVLQEHTVSVRDAKPGVYRISFIASDDVFIRKITTTSQHWVLGTRVYFGDTVGYLEGVHPGQVWTDSRHVIAQTFHAEGLQQVSLGTVVDTLKETQRAVRLDRTDADTAPVLLQAPKGDARFIIDGFAALRQDAFFEPQPRRFTDGTKLDIEGTDAVVTPYVRPIALEGNWHRATFHLSIPSTIDTLRFALSAPGISSRLGSVDVRRISLTYHRPANTWSDWMHVIRQELVNAWHRL